MSASLSDVLLRIAAAIAADGGAAVRAALEGALREAAPFEAGEVALVPDEGDPRRQPLGAAEGSFLGKDLLAHVTAHGAAYRIDDWRDAEPFPETLALLRARALRSLLVVPFRIDASSGSPLLGALAVGRSHGWAFAGASLPLLMPIAGMAGLALDRALVLTSRGERAPDPVPARPPDSEALLPDALSVATSLREEQAKARDRLARAEAAEERLLEAERSRDEWAQKAASLRTQGDEQAAEIQSLRRGMAGARETAAAAADLAESGQARIRELQERASELEATIRALESVAREREGEAHRLDEAAGKIASLQHELRCAHDQISALSVPAPPAASGGSRGGRKARPERE